MKHVKKLVALLMAFVLVMGFSTTAFAAETEENTIPEHATKHTIEMTVEPGESVAPYIWGNNTFTPPVGGVTYSAKFNIPDRYFAYECSAIGTNGNVINSTCSVALLISYDAPITNIPIPIDGNTYKNDWIDLNPGSYMFKIINNSGSPISVTITYYSWA
jgi:hypothetical protein